ncbi:hypothetical protein KI688_011506 [Linnemannia hyalina]|uniref:Uncharacterized protein n=1 Tax=Linnemannia hyalina TaxID=64524 RepID=A0A9P8BTR3_9FUNG|nr:hypothetical protein KI688_011506 [Linnemannia hyalina]
MAHVIALHLAQGSLFQCIQASKSWHAAFIPHLWRTFTEDGRQTTSWGALVAAIHTRRRHPEGLEWFKDVYRRHAKYIRHLTFHMPTILDACLEDAFEPLSPPLAEDSRTGPSGAGARIGAEAVAVPIATIAGRSLITNLESLTINVSPQNLEMYFPELFSRMQSRVFSFGGGAFGGGGFGAAAANNNITTTYDNTTTTNPIGVMPEVTGAGTADPERPFIEACLRLILNNPGLQTLYCVNNSRVFRGLQEIVQSAAGGEDGGTGRNSCSGSGSALRSLKILTIMSEDGLIPVLPPSVTNLTLIRNFGMWLDSKPGVPGPVHEGLEVLETSAESAAHIVALLNQAPSLKTLSIKGFGSRGYGFGGSQEAHAPVSNGFAWPLASQITVLKCWQSRGGSFVNVPAFERFFRCFPMLVEYHDDIWLPAVGAQLAEHCPFLEVISVPQKPNPNNRYPLRRLGVPVPDSVSLLLSSLSRLRVLDLSRENIKAKKILETPWVCLDLEEFCCQIVEVPYLTEEEERQVQEIRQREEAGAIGSVHQHRADKEEELMGLYQRCVYTRKHIMAQLSKLTSLKHLSLSPDLKIGNELFEFRHGATRCYKSERDGRIYIRYNDVLPDTLHLRLDTGLDQLSSLEKLEYLGFESMDHRMDTAEVEWMAKQFPRLKDMRGLVTEGHVGIEPDLKNDALVALMRRLRPEVAQRQSFGGYGAGSQTGGGLFGGFGQPVGAVESRS